LTILANYAGSALNRRSNCAGVLPTAEPGLGDRGTLGSAAER